MIMKILMHTLFGASKELMDYWIELERNRAELDSNYLCDTLRKYRVKIYILSRYFMWLRNFYLIK